MLSAIIHALMTAGKIGAVRSTCKPVAQDTYEANACVVDANGTTIGMSRITGTAEHIAALSAAGAKFPMEVLRSRAMRLALDNACCEDVIAIEKSIKNIGGR
jgi:hypothetical protein